MIRVVVYGHPVNGLWPYRVDGHWGPDGAPLVGVSFTPLMEACRVLTALGVTADTPIRLFVPHRRAQDTTVGQGADLPYRLPPPAKALPAPRRRPRKRLTVTGSGVPGDG